MPCLKKIFGNNLRDFRLQCGLSQEELAERLNLTSHSISNIERGVHGPRFTTLEKLVNELGVSAGDLFRNDIRPPPHSMTRSSRD
ncbi:MAG: helix-turn-helix transcriptional regulator [Gammaproteobacteria bacterium]|nr:helix-turn-helix transcriptional regulator [Gammaproteobacteria bacterium]